MSWPVVRLRPAAAAANRCGLRAGHRKLHAELELRRPIEIVGFREFGDRYVIAARDAEHGVAAIYDVNRRRRCRGGNGLARRSGCRCGRPRNDQLLARRQDARSLVTVGLQDRGGRNVIAARQGIECIAGADDDRGTAMPRSVVRRDRAWCGTASGFNRLARRSIGSYPAAPFRGGASGVSAA